jgi:hypothetical protein
MDPRNPPPNRPWVPLQPRAAPQIKVIHIVGFVMFMFVLAAFMSSGSGALSVGLFFFIGIGAFAIVRTIKKPTGDQQSQTSETGSPTATAAIRIFQVIAIIGMVGFLLIMGLIVLIFIAFASGGAHI